MTSENPEDLDADQIVDQLYDIALDPGSLDRFIDTWNAAGLDAQKVRRTVQQIDSFDATFQNHLSRAETFLKRGNDDDATPLSDALAPFESAAALILNRNFQVVACNAGAQASFGIQEGHSIADLPLADTLLETFEATLKDVVSTGAKPDRLLNLELQGTSRPTLFHIRRLSQTDADGMPLLLIVTTHYHWQPALGATLEEVFQLTAAEQGVVRALIEGRDAKSIAVERGTSEGTVRSQIKSILSKMNARSQSEVIRLVLSLRDVVTSTPASAETTGVPATKTSSEWLDAEVWKPFKTLTLPDGRRMDYHDQGPVTGAPVLFSHMGYGQVRWPKPLLKLAYKHGLRVICPIRAGYGQSDNINRSDDVLAACRNDTLFLLQHLGITRLPYVPQGNDLIFAVDLAAEHPGVVSEIIGLCARPSLPGDRHYSSMGKWHRFFLSTAQHAPHLLYFSVKAAVSMARRIGVIEMYRNMNGNSSADMNILENPEIGPVMAANGALVASKEANASQAYAMETQRTEEDWSDRVMAARATPIMSFSGVEDPAVDMGTLADYREAYPWFTFDVLENAGQMLIFQQFETVIPRIAAAAHAAKNG